MNNFSRRDFMRRGGLGLAALGVGGLTLRAGEKPTPASGTLGKYGEFLALNDKEPVKAADKLQVTEDNILGPYYRAGAPFRAKITPPLEAGTVLLITGRVWGFDTKKPLKHAILDIWQANSHGRYDNDDPRKPPAANIFLNRARLISDENGYYEYETIHPGAYQIGAKEWRPAHIHYMVSHPNYERLVTQMYFRNDPHNKTDSFIKESLIIDVRKEKANNNAAYEAGTFDIVLAPAKK